MARRQKIGVTGLVSVKRGVAAAKATVKTATTEAIQERTQEMYNDLQLSMTGKYPGRHTTRIISGSPRPGSGMDVPGSVLDVGMIGDWSGRMKASLQSKVSNKPEGPVGEVGFGKRFKVPADSSVQALTTETPKINVVDLERQDPLSDRRDRFKPKDPQEYIPEVLLGTDKFVGRNILRLELYQDINGNITKRHVASKVKEALK